MGILGKIFGGGSKPEELDDTTIERAIRKSHEKPVLIDFYSTTCAPCRVMSGLVMDLRKEMIDDAYFFKADVAFAPQHSMKFGVRSVPTVVIFRKGKAVNRQVGLATLDELRQRMKSYM